MPRFLKLRVALRPISVGLVEVRVVNTLTYNLSGDHHHHHHHHCKGGILNLRIPRNRDQDSRRTRKNGLICSRLVMGSAETVNDRC